MPTMLLPKRILFTITRRPIILQVQMKSTIGSRSVDLLNLTKRITRYGDQRSTNHATQISINLRQIAYSRAHQHEDHKYNTHILQEFTDRKGRGPNNRSSRHPRRSRTFNIPRIITEGHSEPTHGTAVHSSTQSQSTRESPIYSAASE